MSAITQSIILVTGANSGIGFELASQLLADSSKVVLLGCRSVEKGTKALKDLQSRNLSGKADLLQIDVSSEGSIENAAKEVERKYGRLDALVNNAAIGEPSGTLAQQFAQSFQTNTTSAYLTVSLFAHLLSNSISTPRVINVTSILGSITARLDASTPYFTQKNDTYRVCKAALNMVTACQAIEYGEKGWKVFAYCPGHTVSGLSEYNKEEFGAKPTSQGARPIVELLNGERDGEHGAFVHEHGTYPW